MKIRNINKADSKEVLLIPKEELEKNLATLSGEELKEWFKALKTETNNRGE